MVGLAAGGAGSRGGRTLGRRAGLAELERGRLAGFGASRLMGPVDARFLACGLDFDVRVEVLGGRPEGSGVLVPVECAIAPGTCCVCASCWGLKSGEHL